MNLSTPNPITQNKKFCASHKHSSRAVLLITGLVVALFLAGVSGDGCHEVEKEIGTELGLSADICSINDALERSPPDYVTAEAYYRVGFASEEPSLKEVATGTFYGNYSEMSTEEFGDENWIDVRLQHALDGKEEFDTHIKRVQFIKKILQSSLLGARMLSNLERAYLSARRRRASSALVHWERALANHYGQDSTCSIFANGQARGIEFDVMEAGVSVANDEIGDAFGAGGRIIKSRGSASRLRKEIDIIQKNFILIYLQAVFKYATRISQGVSAEKGQAEGYAYYHAILPFVRAVNAEADSTILECFDISSEPDAEKADDVLELFPGLLDDLDISILSFGVFDDENSDTYEPSEDPECEAFNPFEVNAVQTFDNDR